MCDILCCAVLVRVEGFVNVAKEVNAAGGGSWLWEVQMGNKTKHTALTCCGNYGNANAWRFSHGPHVSFSSYFFFFLFFSLLSFFYFLLCLSFLLYCSLSGQTSLRGSHMTTRSSQRARPRFRTSRRDGEDGQSQPRNPTSVDASSAARAGSPRAT